MRAGHPQERFTLAQVALWDISGLDDLDRGDALDYTPSEAQGAVAAWVWLLGVGTTGPAFEAVRHEVLHDGLVFAAMHRPVTEFLNLWRGFAWEDFDRPEGWGWGVLDRARALAADLGPVLAQQVTVVAAVCRAAGR